MERVQINEMIDATLTQMRQSDAFGVGNEELLDGNMIPRLCAYAGESACAQTCQLKQLRGRGEEPEEPVGKLCAEDNILATLAAQNLNPENVVLAAATKDRVIFADQIDESGATRHPDGYTLVPDANGFFFRPGEDMTAGRHRQLYEAKMRMADCGDVVVEGTDTSGKQFVGQGHFSRTNMFGPSAFGHELDGKKVSWGEYFIGSAIEHYNADPASIRVVLGAAVEREDFVHHYDDKAKMEAHFKGWDELGFMHPEEGKENDFDCEIDYREMIVWQLTDGIQNPKYRLAAEQIDTTRAVNTGDLSLGFASHHKASHGEIAHGRDLYGVGLNPRQAIAARIDELSTLQAGREWTMRTFGEMTDEDYDAFAKLVSEGNRELRGLKAVQSGLEGGSEDE